MFARLAVAVAMLAFAGQTIAQIIIDGPDPHAVYIRVAYHDSDNKIVPQNNFPESMVEQSRLFVAMKMNEYANKGFNVFYPPCINCSGGILVDFYPSGMARVRFKDVGGIIRMDRGFRFAEPAIALNSGVAKHACVQGRDLLPFLFNNPAIFRAGVRKLAFLPILIYNAYQC